MSSPEKSKTPKKWVSSSDVIEECREKNEEPDWESGTIDTFIGELIGVAEPLSGRMSEEFFEKLAIEVQNIHGEEYGMHQDFHDLARQQWLARFLVTAIKHTLGEARTSTPSLVADKPREAIFVQIDALILALRENIDAASDRRNVPPSFDLALHENTSFIAEVRRLTEALVELRQALGNHPADSTAPTVSLAKDALREFVMKLSGNLGEGLGKTVTWGSRMALAWFAIGILRDLGVPVEGMIKAIQQSVFPK